MSERRTEEEPSSPIERIPPPYSVWVDFFIDKMVIVIAIILLYIWKQGITPKLESIKEVLDRRQNISREIYECLSSIRTIAKAERAILGQFHNGIYWASGLPWLQITATHEVTAPGVTKVSKDIKSIPIERLGKEIKSMMETDIIIVDIKDAPEGCDRYLHSIGCNRILEALVYSGKGKPIGILSVQYNRQSNLPDLNKEEREEIVQAIAVLGSVMNENPKRSFLKKISSLVDKKP